MRTTFAVASLALAGLVGCNAILGIPGDVVDVATADAGRVAEAGSDASIVLPDRGDSGRDAHPEAAKDAAIEAPRDSGGPGDGADGDAYTGGPNGVVAVSSSIGIQDWCAVTAAGAVWCWGDNEASQLGDDSGLSSTVPGQFKGIPDPVASVSVGYFTTCAVTKPGGVFCWGYGNDGELGNGEMTNTTATPVPVVGLSSGVVAVSNANLVACALKADGSVWCWGIGADGELGNGMAANSDKPTPVTGLTSGVTSISVGGDTVCAVQNGAVFCWGGFSGDGEIGDGSLQGSFTPVAVPTLASGVKAVSAGFTFVCALTDAGAVLCWGEGDLGELGNGALVSSPIPVPVTGLSSGVVAISAGNEATCAVKDDGSVWCWGYGNDGSLGTGATLFGSGAVKQAETAVPVRVPGLTGVTSISAGGNAPCATTLSGQLECWGLTAEVALFPVDVVGLQGSATAVTLGGVEDSMGFGCAIEGSGATTCWGGGGDGQLGDGQTTNSLVPVQEVSVLIQGTTSLSTGSAADSACAVIAGNVQCWGDNRKGQLGDGSTTSSPKPVSVRLPVGVTITQVAVGHESACGLASTGAVYCWGDNTFGELGDGTTASHHVPVQVTGLSDATQVSVGIDYACAVLGDHTVHCWGNNTSGTIGDGTTMVRKTPVAVLGVTGALSVSAGWYAACAVTAAGTIECWGSNTSGQLGIGGPEGSLTAIEVANITHGATAVSMGWESTCALVSGGVLCWGSCALGDGLYNLQLVPTPVVSTSGTPLSGATAIAVGLGTACAVVRGAIQCWGSNTAGQLGTGSPSNELVPTLVPGFPAP